MSAKPISRERQVLDYLASHPEGVQFGELRLALASDVEATKFGGTISTLMRRKKIVRVGKVRHYKYRLNATPPADQRRTRATPAPKGSVPVNQGARRTAIATPPASIPAAAALSLNTFPGAPARSHVVDARQADRDAIARDIAAFLKRGGKIQKLRHGEHSQSGKSQAEQQSEFLATRSRASVIPLNRRAKRAA